LFAMASATSLIMSIIGIVDARITLSKKCDVKVRKGLFVHPTTCLNISMQADLPNEILSPFGIADSNWVLNYVNLELEVRLRPIWSARC
jgi:hypothetical protein